MTTMRSGAPELAALRADLARVEASSPELKAVVAKLRADLDRTR
jgi:hypothetical protein